jgi:glutathione S-transferase
MTKVNFFWISGSPPAWRVMLALEIKRVDYISHPLDASVQAHKSPEFLKLNPRGKVPVLQIGDIVVRESLAIIAYLDRLQPEPALLGKDASTTAAIWQWLMEFENYLCPALATGALALFQGRVEEQRHEVSIATEIIHAEIQRIDQHLSQQEYLCGDSLSAADITLYPSMQWLKRALEKDRTSLQLTHLLANCKGLKRWEGMIEALPGYQRTYPPHWQSHSSSPSTV